VAEERDDLLPEFDDNEEDVLFQVQMRVYNLFMANWKKLLIVSAVFLTVVLVQGLYADHIQDKQRHSHGELMFVKTELPEPNQMALYGMAPADNPNDLKRMEQLRSAAQEIEKIANNSTGVATWFAWMEAGKTWKRANEVDAQIIAYQKAASLQETAPLIASATLQLANAYQESDKSEQAIKTLEDFIATVPNSGMQQAQINLALYYEEGGNKEKAKEILQTVKGSDSFNADVAMIMGRVSE
jgi:tetratricopeptide (TPR) repeat protein